MYRQTYHRRKMLQDKSDEECIALIKAANSTIVSNLPSFFSEHGQQLFATASRLLDM